MLDTLRARLPAFGAARVAVSRDRLAAAGARFAPPGGLIAAAGARFAPPGGLIAGASALLAPPACWSCRVPAPVGHVLCPQCRSALPFLRGPCCARCGLPQPCGRRCPGLGSPLARAWAPVAFDGPARALVHALKFRGALAVADVMAAQIVAGAPAGLLGPGRVLVPVPTAASRRRARGFDQAERLAAAIGRRTGLPIARCLRRRGAATRQAGASRAARRAPGRVVVRVHGEAPPIAVLIDDVHTTGATLEACARALLDKGSEDVCAITYARALRSRYGRRNVLARPVNDREDLHADRGQGSQHSGHG
jgi:predicted amidophosphoribosyltransferase